MRIIYFGTPEFAVEPLKKIIESGYEVCAVVTAPDKERGRGRKVTFTPVKEFAVEKNIPVLQPDKLKDDYFISELKNFAADLFVVVAFRILPREVFAIPKFGSFNLHGSLLPKYRGAAPIQWALINGDTETGLTTFFLEEKVDTGNIILQKKVVVSREDDFASLHDKMSLEGAGLIVETIKAIERNDYRLIAQDNSFASPAPKITKELCEINWELPALRIHNLIRALCPVPGAFFKHNKKIYKVYKSEVFENKSLPPGKIEESKTEIFIGTGNGSLKILEIRPEGRKRLKTEDFLRGYSLKEK